MENKTIEKMKTMYNKLRILPDSFPNEYRLVASKNRRKKNKNKLSFCLSTTYNTDYNFGTQGRIDLWNEIIFPEYERLEFENEENLNFNFKNDPERSNLEIKTKDSSAGLKIWSSLITQTTKKGNRIKAKFYGNLR